MNTKECLTIAALVGLIMLFQNCGVGFKPTHKSIRASSSSSQASSLPASDTFDSTIGDTVEAGKSPYTCVDENQMAGVDLKRLSKRQYLNTVRDLLGLVLTPPNAQTLFGDFAADLNLPEDAGAFSRMDTALTSFHVQGYFQAAKSLAAKLVSASYKNEFIRAAVALNPGACATVDPANLSQVCKTQLLRNLSLRLLRRPLSESGAEWTNLNTEFTSAPNADAALENVLFSLLLNPYFLNRIENDGTILTGTTYQLSAYAAASRLSYMYWNTMPDEGLLKIAAALNVSDEAQMEAAISYVFSKPERLTDFLNEFYLEWSGVKGLRPFFNNGTQKFAALTAGISPNEALRMAMANEVVELGRYISLNKGSFTDLFTTNISFARHPDLMTIYDQSVAAPAVTTGGNAVRFPAGERAGLLTRAAMVYTGSENANPVRRGLHIKRDFLCQTVPNPSAELAQQIQSVQFAEQATTRARYEAATSPAACMGCHNSINPVGFGLSNFNAFGKYETQEPIFSTAGVNLNLTLPVNAAVDLTAVVGSPVRSSTPVEYRRQLSESAAARSCFTEKISIFSGGSNTCGKASVFKQLESNAPLEEIFKSFARDKNFRKRLVVQ